MVMMDSYILLQVKLIVEGSVLQRIDVLPAAT